MTEQSNKQQRTIDFTPGIYRLLKSKYQNAVEKGKKQFTLVTPDWQEYEFVTDYAKYLLQYLESKGVGKL